MNHGIFIPKEIWGLKLPVTHRCILGHIYYYTKNKSFCDSSTAHLSREMGCSSSKINKTIKELMELGYIDVETKTAAPALWDKYDHPLSHRIMKCKPIKDLS